MEALSACLQTHSCSFHRASLDTTFAWVILEGAPVPVIGVALVCVRFAQATLAEDVYRRAQLDTRTDAAYIVILAHLCTDYRAFVVQTACLCRTLAPLSFFRGTLCKQYVKVSLLRAYQDIGLLARDDGSIDKAADTVINHLGMFPNVE